jgi:hypothetical protein
MTNHAWRSTKTLSNAQRKAQIINCSLDDLVEGQDQDQLQTYFDTFSSLSLPPLDQVTICSELDSSSSDVSSVSSDEDDGTTTSQQSPVVPRAIFGRYWEKKGGAPALSKTAPTRHVDDEVSCGSYTYERTLKVQESQCGKVVSTPQSPTRRTIFKSCVSESSPTLIAMMLQQEQLRKTQSTSALTKKPSCLRSSRFAAAPRRESSDSLDRSVTFSTKVDIVVFQRPVELWAPKGWSDYFS